jgi:hypothetical protein
MYLIADRLVQGERANVAAAQAERTQLTPPDIFANGIEAQPAQMREVMLTPRDIANEVLPQGAAFRAQHSDALTTAINNEIRDLPVTDEELHTYVNAVNSRPLDLPGPIENYLTTDAQRNRISDYLIQQASARIDTLQRQAERQALQVQDNAGLTPEYMTYLRTRLADATTGDEITALERDFLQVGNPQGYSPAQIQLIEREIGQRSNEVLRGNQPALREPNSVGNVVQNLINQYPERNQIQALIDDFERGEISELPVAIQNADDFVRDETVSEILDQLVEYRDGLRRPNQARAIDEEPRAELPAPEVRPNVRYGNNVMDAYTGILEDNDQFRTFESLDALRALPQLIRRPGASRNSLGIGAFDTEQVNQLARIFDALYDARYQEFVRRGDAPEGRKRGGSIQSSKNRLLSPNTDEMRLALLKGK